MLMRLREVRSALPCPDCWSLRVEGRAAPKTSFRPSYSLEGDSISSEEAEPAPYPSAGMATPLEERNPFDADKPSYSTRPSHPHFAGSRKEKPDPAPKTSDVPALASIDVGLQLILEAIGKQEEEWLCSDSEGSYEAATTMDLTLGEAPSFLDDIREYLLPI